MSNASPTHAPHDLSKIQHWKPSLLLRNGHLQTMWSTRRRANVLQKSVGIQIAGQAPFTWTGQLYKNQGTRIVILFHGLGGRSDSAYMLEATKSLLSSGYDVACMSLPGNEHSDAYTYHAGDYVYLNQIEAYFSQYYQDLHWMGFSLGGNIVLKWLSQSKPQSKSMVVSPVIDLMYGVEQVDRKAYGLYRRHFLTSLTQVIRQKIALNQKKFQPYASALSARTLQGFDQAITCPFHGYATSDAYYQTNQALHDLQNISTPTLILAAQDDPFSLPEHFCVANDHPYLKSILPLYGGHVGFFEGFGSKSMLSDWIGIIFKQQ